MMHRVGKHCHLFKTSIFHMRSFVLPTPCHKKEPTRKAYLPTLDTTAPNNSSISKLAGLQQLTQNIDPSFDPLTEFVGVERPKLSSIHHLSGTKAQHRYQPYRHSFVSVYSDAFKEFVNGFYGPMYPSNGISTPRSKV